MYVKSHNKRCERANPKNKCHCKCGGALHGILYLKNEKQTTIDMWIKEEKEKMQIKFKTTEFEQAVGFSKEMMVNDVLGEKILQLEKAEERKNFNEAEKILDNIKLILDKPQNLKITPAESDCRTLYARNI